MEENKESTFNRLFKVDVSGQVEKKQNLSYLSWSFAWANVKKRCPDAVYEIKKFEHSLPYVYDENTGYMVFTSVTIDGITHEMWLPVMDNSNNAMKSKPYTYKTKSGEHKVEAATMFDVNKTIMRCLVKNLAMFGLGLYIYAGEDLPIEIETTEKTYADYLAELTGYYEKDIPAENLEEIKKIIESKDEEACHTMYDRTYTYLYKKKLIK